MTLAVIAVVLIVLSGLLFAVLKRAEERKAANEAALLAKRLQAAMHDPRPWSSKAAKGWKSKGDAA